MSLALVVDIGTSNVKAGIVNPEGEVVALKSIVNPSSKPERGAYEHDSEGLLKIIADLTKTVAGPYKDSISYLGISGYQFGFLPLDEKGLPLTGMMTLLDNRSKVVMDRVRSEFPTEDIYRKTGCPPLFTYAFTKLIWLKEHKPDIFGKAHRYADLKSFLLEQWTGQFVTEPSIAGATQLLNVHESDWDDEILALAGIERLQLPKIVPGNEFVGELTAQAAETLGLNKNVKVLPGLYDGAALILGMGGQDENIAVCNLGTTAMLRGLAKEPLLDDAKKMRLQTYPCLPGFWVTGGALNNAGVTLRWFRDTFDSDSSFENIIKQAKEVKTGAEGLFCLPFLTGERDPRIGGQASASFFGIREFHTKAHMARSVLEGVTYALNLVKEAASENQFRPKVLRIGGSGAKSNLWANILANCLNIPVQRTSTPEAALIGIGMLCFTASGIYTSLKSASETMIETGELFTPASEEVAHYTKSYPFFTQLVSTMKEMYALHSEIRRTIPT